MTWQNGSQNHLFGDLIRVKTNGKNLLCIRHINCQQPTVDVVGLGLLLYIIPFCWEECHSLLVARLLS